MKNDLCLTHSLMVILLQRIWPGIGNFTSLHCWLRSLPHHIFQVIKRVEMQVIRVQAAQHV